LLQIARYEEEINKEIYNMSIPETKSCIDTLTRTTLNASSSLLSKLATYFFWASANHFAKDEQMLAMTLSWLKDQKGEDIVSKVAMSNQYLTKEKIYYQVAKFCQNKQNEALIILLFKGVEGIELCELRNIKKSDINFKTNSIHLTGYLSKTDRMNVYNRDILLTDYEMDIINDALDQHNYNEEVNSKEVRDPIPLLETDMLFKNIQKNRAKPDYIVKRSELIKRIREISQEVQKPLTAGNLIMSGQIYELTQLNKEFKDITREDYITILQKYNKRINISSIINLSSLYKYLLENGIEVAVSQ
jgi:integrase